MQFGSRTSKWAASALACALVASACTGGGGDDADPTTTTDAVTSTTEGSTPPTSAASSPSTTEVTTPPASTYEVVEPDPDPTEISLDDAVRSGRLDNGLTYYAMSNDSPGSKLELRLVVNAGSAKQEVADSGGAHFLEHMLFNGTERFPANELDDVLRSFGMEIGPDLNAYTSLDETVYILSVPTANPAAVDNAFDVLVDWATAATIDEQAVIDERGVVREELRLRDESPDGKILDVLFDAYYADSSYDGYEPSGSVERVNATVADDLRAFYERWYRLDNIGVVAVGDLPVGDIVDRIEDAFGPLDADDGDAAEFEYQVDDLDDDFVALAIHPDGPEPNVSLDYGLPNWDRSTLGGERLLFLDDIVTEMLVARLSDGVARGELDLVRAGGGTFEAARLRRFLGFNFVAEDEAAGTEIVLTEIEKALAQGFNDAELNRIVTQIQGGLDQRLDAVETRQDASIASDLVAHHLSGTAFDDPVATHERQSAVLDSITTDEATNHLRYLMSRSAPILIPIGNDAADLPTVDELEAAIAAAGQASFDDATVEVSSVQPGDPLMDRPEPVEEARRRVHNEFDAVEVEFDNGVRLFVAESDIAEASVAFEARSSGGASLLDPLEVPVADLVTNAVSESGVGDFDAVDLDTILSGAVVGVGPSIGETSDGFSGGASVDDLETMFQWLHLLMTEPRIDESAWRNAQEIGRQQARQADTEPRLASFIELLDARTGGSPYMALVPDVERVESMTATEALDLYRSRLGGVDDMTFVVVGDIDRDDVIDLARSYLATLPTRPGDEAVDHLGPPPSGVISRTVDAGEDGSGAGVDLLFTVASEPNDTDRAAALVLENAVNARFFDSVREDLAASYNGGRISIDADQEFGYIDLFATVDGDPDRLDVIYERVLDELFDVADNGISNDEFESAKAVVLNDLDFINNGDLINQLLDFASRGDDAWTLRREYSGVLEADRGDVNDLARRLIDQANWIEVFRAET